MRTSKEIENYLLSASFYDNYLLNLGKYRHCDTNNLKERAKACEKYLRGNAGDTTFISAFSWENSPEGFEFWAQIDDDFQRWYNRKQE